MFAVLIYDFILQPKNIPVQISMRKRTPKSEPCALTQTRICAKWQMEWPRSWQLWFLAEKEVAECEKWRLLDPNTHRTRPAPLDTQTHTHAKCKVPVPQIKIRQRHRSYPFVYLLFEHVRWWSHWVCIHIETLLHNLMFAVLHCDYIVSSVRRARVCASLFHSFRKQCAI